MRPAGTPATEGFNPSSSSVATPLVPKPPLQSTTGKQSQSGTSTLRLLEIAAAVAFMLSAGAFVWERKRR